MSIYEETVVEIVEEEISLLNDRFATRGVAFQFHVGNNPFDMKIRILATIEERVYPFSSPGNPFGRIHQESGQVTCQFPLDPLEVDFVTKTLLVHPDGFRQRLRAGLDELEQEVLLRIPRLHQVPSRPWEAMRVVPLKLGRCDDSNLFPEIMELVEGIVRESNELGRQLPERMEFDLENRPIREMAFATRQNPPLCDRSKYNRKCQNYGHTAGYLRPCALHPGRENGCEGCTDFTPHPLAEVFDLSKTISVLVGHRYFAVCSPAQLPAAPGQIFSAVAAKGLLAWQEEYPELSPRHIYFLGDRKTYHHAIAHLGVEQLPHFNCEMNAGEKIQLFCVEA